ncbi:MAG: glycosyltransferase [Syntrophomonas sp.]
MANIFTQLTRFGFTGILNTCIDYGIFNILVVSTGINSGWRLGLINLLAVGAAAANSYFMNRMWTFSSRDHNIPGELSRFVLVTGLGMIINSLLVVAVSGLASRLPVSLFIILNAGKLLGALFSVIWNFVLYRQWVFSSRRQAPVIPIIEDEVQKDLLSIIIPAYNEAARLPRRLQQLAAALGGRFPLEILVVDDGSVDQTRQIAEDIAGHYPFIRVLSHQRNQGKGAAVRTGVMAARGEYLVFVDADESFSSEHIEKLLAKLRSGHRVVIGKRSCPQGERVIGESSLRHFLGRSFNILVQVLLLPGIKDTQCGIKGFHRQLARQIFPRQRVARFAFDVELLSLARMLDADIYELPLQVQDCQGSTVHPIFAPLQMAWDLGRIKAAMIFNLYHLHKPKPGLPLAAGMGLFLAALAVRLPWLWQVPRYIDELKEVKLAYAIYAGQALPLHNAAHDIGALHNYILAAIFKLFGPSIYWPRLYVAITGALTVVLVYRLGLMLFDRWTALLAAGFLLTSGMHIMVNHMAWGNCTTPFFFVLAIIATEKARLKQNGGWLLGAALLWAATLQTHSSAIIYVLVAALYILSPRYRSQAGLGRRWYWGAAGLFLAGYANMIYYNISSLGGSFRWLSNKSYALEQQPGLWSFITNLERMIIELLRSISSTYVEHQHIWQYFTNPLFVMALLLLLLGFWVAWQKQQKLLIGMIVGGMLVIPWINHRYVFYLATRYIMPLNICALLLVAAAVVYLLQTVRTKLKSSRFIIIPVSLALCLFIIMQLIPFYNYCRQNDSTNLSNRLALQIMSVISSNGKKNTLVLLDENLPLENAPLPYLLTISQQQYRLFKNRESEAEPGAWNLAQLLGRYDGQELLLVMNQDTYLNNRSQIENFHKHIFKSRVVFPSEAEKQRVIYLVEMNSQPRSTAADSNNSKTLPVMQQIPGN